MQTLSLIHILKIAYSASMDEFSVACGYRTMKITDEFLVKGYYLSLIHILAW